MSLLFFFSLSHPRGTAPHALSVRLPGFFLNSLPFFLNLHQVGLTLLFSFVAGPDTYILDGLYSPRVPG